MEEDIFPRPNNYPPEGAGRKMNLGMNASERACFVLGGIVPPSTDYCAVSYCSAGETNVGCNPPPLTGGPSCGDSPMTVTITETLKARFLDQHNSRRSTLATGSLASFSPAQRMPTLQWDDELASQAGHNARSCTFAHDECRNTQLFSYAGQNLALKQFSGDSWDEESTIDEFVNMWWAENADTTTAQIDSYPSSSPASPIGHFTQMASDRTWKVGCAMQFWIDGIWRTVYCVCNYSFTNMIGQPVYVTGTSASGCTTNQNPQYPGLCSVDETILSEP
ncbi:venom allergen 3-like [Anopheles ziemanni]|uniref:venom allergen 3-like n=1 Tax=Anopheles coustani TaxID=139045 RepID=UPI002657C122|nr:venom allergen 3-like [Anopheles coustani]XP_058178375.1 venom allergen 3-like [Anopheles ziemanni]